uniref:Uncharacterized protein n=1 Tax=Anguilla anguilla TaxID=7936 RepID=A0A0E9ULK7_ANGAN
MTPPGVPTTPQCFSLKSSIIALWDHQLLNIYNPLLGQ